MTSDNQKYNHPMVIMIYDYLYTGDTMFGYRQEDDSFMLDDGSHVTLDKLHERKEKFIVITRRMLVEVFDQYYIHKKEAHLEHIGDDNI